MEVLDLLPPGYDVRDVEKLREEVERKVCIRCLRPAHACGSCKIEAQLRMAAFILPELRRPAGIRKISAS